VADEGDEHAASGVNVCSQSIRLRDLAAALHKAPPPATLLLSLSPDPPYAGTAASGPRASFRCAARRRLSANETAAWRDLSPWLGPPPLALSGYSGGSFAVSRERVRQRPRALWAAMLRRLLGRDAGAEGGGDALAALLQAGLWSAALGEPFDDSFRCDTQDGWGSPGGAARPFELPRPSMFRPAADVAAQVASPPATVC